GLCPSLPAVRLASRLAPAPATAAASRRPQAQACRTRRPAGTPPQPGAPTGCALRRLAPGAVAEEGYTMRLSRSIAQPSTACGADSFTYEFSPVMPRE